MRTRRLELAKDPKKIKKIIAQGGEKASKIANKKMQEVREKVGLIL